MTTEPSTTERQHLPLLTLLVLATIGLDQWTKHLARAILAYAPPHEYLGGHVSLLYAENTGAFLSLGATMPPMIRTAIFTGFVALALIGGTWALLTGRVNRTSDAYAVALLIGGGIGNVIDRIARSGSVTDFIYISIAGPLHTGVFNVADMAITGAVLWLAVTSWGDKKPVASQV